MIFISNLFDVGTVADEVLHFKSNYLLIILIDRYETYFEIKTDSLFIHGENFRILRAYLVFISNFRKWRNGRQRHLPAIKPILHQSNSAIRLWRFSFFLSFMFFFFFLFVCNFGTGEMAATLFPPPIPSPLFRSDCNASNGLESNHGLNEQRN